MAFLLANLLIAGCLLSNTQAAKSPNILILFADDIGTGDLPIYWNSSLVDMPNLQRLAEKGVMFTDAHANVVCAPSRYMLLSGNNPHRGTLPKGSWELNFDKGSNQFLSNQKSIAEVLSTAAGYTTGIFGKWHLGGGVPLKNDNSTKQENCLKFLTHEDHLWTTEPIINGPQDIGFDKSYITVAGIQNGPYSFFQDGYLTTNKTDVVSWERGCYNASCGRSCIGSGDVSEGDASWDSSAYNQILVNETTKFIDQHLVNSQTGDPFFVYVPLGAAHTPHTPPDRYLDGSPVAGEYGNRFLEILLEMDKAVGSLVDVIESRKLAKNTVIIFASDNGGLPYELTQASNHYTNGPLRDFKGSPYEGGHRIPLIIRYDGQFPPGEVRSQLVSLTDIYATLCDLVGVKVPKKSARDSISFLGYMYTAANKKVRRWLKTFLYRKNSPTEAIRHNEMKAIRTTTKNGDVEYELYNLEDDISETTNLALNPSYEKTLITMLNKISKKSYCATIRGRNNIICKHYTSCNNLKTWTTTWKGKVKDCKWVAKNPNKKRCSQIAPNGIHAYQACSCAC